MKQAQRDVCRRYGAGFDALDLSCKLGISAGALRGEQPLNGLRHPPENGTNGWYIWGREELSADPEFFMPLHAHHLQKLCVSVLPYLALPPGWRFLIAPDYEDVWYDSTLLAPPD